MRNGNGGDLYIRGFYGSGNAVVHITTIHILLDKTHNMFIPNCMGSWEM